MSIATTKLSDMEFLKILKEKCVAITGGIATGKSTIANILRSKGFYVLDADQLSRQIMNPGEEAYGKTVKIFGSNILNKDNTINRDKLREIVMNHPEARASLESITHPAIQEKLKDVIKNSPEISSSNLFFYEAALIFEVNRQDIFRETWLTDCPETVQLSRLMKRSHLAEDSATKIIKAQMPASQKAGKATRVINTDCSVNTMSSVLDLFVQDVLMQNSKKLS